MDLGVSVRPEVQRSHKHFSLNVTDVMSELQGRPFCPSHKKQETRATLGSNPLLVRTTGSPLFFSSPSMFPLSSSLLFTYFFTSHVSLSPLLFLTLPLVSSAPLICSSSSPLSPPHFLSSCFLSSLVSSFSSPAFLSS